MTREEAIKKRRDADCGDPECSHVDGDRVRCELLTSLGYADVVAEWEKLPKWYA